MFFLSGCGLSKAKPEAEELWFKYFEILQSDSFEAVLPLYSDAFFKTTSKKEWLIILKQIKEKLGRPENYKLINWKVQAQAHASMSGTVVTLIYDVHYTKNVARETLIVFKPAAGGKASILAHNINSNVFLSN